MKKIILAGVLCIGLTATLFAGCGSSNDGASNNANTESNVTESNQTVNAETEITETEVVTEISMVSFDEDPYQYFNIGFGTFNFNLVDANGDYEALITNLTDEGWVYMEGAYNPSEHSGKNRFELGREIYYTSDGTKYSYVLDLKFNKKAVADLKFNLYGGLEQNSLVEELFQVWGEPDYTFYGAVNTNYYVSPCGYIEVVCSDSDEFQGISRITFFYSEYVDCEKYFKNYVDPENENVLTKWVTAGLIDIDMRSENNESSSK